MDGESNIIAGVYGFVAAGGHKAESIKAAEAEGNRELPIRL